MATVVALVQQLMWYKCKYCKYVHVSLCNLLPQKQKPWRGSSQRNTTEHIHKRERGRKGERERGREGERERGREGEREGGREGVRERGRE